MVVQIKVIALFWLFDPVCSSCRMGFFLWKNIQKSLIYFIDTNYNRVFRCQMMITIRKHSPYKSHSYGRMLQKVKFLHTSQKEVWPSGWSLSQFPWHEATWSISTSPWMGCQSIAGLPSNNKFAGTHLGGES